jgi:hypothetical protein
MNAQSESMEYLYLDVLDVRRSTSASTIDGSEVFANGQFGVFGVGGSGLCKLDVDAERRCMTGLFLAEARGDDRGGETGVRGPEVDAMGLAEDDLEREAIEPQLFLTPIRKTKAGGKTAEEALAGLYTHSGSAVRSLKVPDEGVDKSSGSFGRGEGGARNVESRSSGVKGDSSSSSSKLLIRK